MEKCKLLEYCTLFREKAEENKLIIFVGAGVSSNVKGMPSWFTLIQKMAKSINYSKCNSCRAKSDCTDDCLLIEDYSTDEFLKIPQYVFNKNQKKYKEVITENISDAIIDAPLSSAIFDINPVHIITTNYDKLIESSSSVFCEQYQVIVKDKDLLNSQKNKYIIKMHGDVSELDTIVLKEQDYLNYSQNHVLIELFLKSLLTNHTILFLGYSLNDYNIKLIISWLNYMRTQNKILGKKQMVGYIVLDDDKLNRTQVDYFEENNIGVINLNQMTLIKNIPPVLSDIRGKRLFSFLRIISNESLEKVLSSNSSIVNAVDFMAKYNFVDYKMLLKLLYIKQYEKNDTQLCLLDEEDYNLLEQFIICDSAKSLQLKQLFINSGIEKIYFTSSDEQKNICIGDVIESKLISNELYLLYKQNKYNDLEQKLKDENCDAMIKYFYQSIICGYEEAISDYKNIDFLGLSLDNKVVFLHNESVLDGIQKFLYDSNNVKHFIENISLKKEKDMFSSFIDMYEGNSRKQQNMKKSLEKLKLDVASKESIRLGGASYLEINKIKNDTTTQYYFYFMNHIFFKGFSDANIFFESYIEALLCASSEQAENSSNFMGISFSNEKYCLNDIDFDIITKFITAKDLLKYINFYKIMKVKTEKENVIHLCNCFENICISLIDAKIYGYNNSAITTLLNLAQILQLVELNDAEKTLIENSIQNLLNDQLFVRTFFTTNNFDFRLSVIIFSDLFEILTFTCNLNIVKNIIRNDDFYNLAINVRFHCLRKIFMSFVSKKLSVDMQHEIDSIINGESELWKKIILIRLLYKCITDDKIKKKYITFLSDNFTKLNKEALYDFVFSDWIKLTTEAINMFLNDIININKGQVEGMHSIPDPVETRLECVYIFFIEKIILDISILSELADGRPHLQFLLSPDDFDYKLVDFSNYMWENFARHDEYMKLFVKHKEDIIPGIQFKLKRDSATETEKKIFYGLLLEDDELWQQ